MSIRSVHSRRTVPTHRSANEFARSARGGALSTSMPDALGSEHRVEDGGELAVTVVEQEPQPGGAKIQVHQQVPRLLGDPGTGWMGCDACDVDLTGGELDEEQDVG